MKTLDKPCIPVFDSEKTITIPVYKINSEKNVCQCQCSPINARRIYIIILFTFLFYYENIPML